jgi:hypothetical protein
VSALVLLAQTGHQDGLGLVDDQALARDVLPHKTLKAANLSDSTTDNTFFCTSCFRRMVKRGMCTADPSGQMGLTD